MAKTLIEATKQHEVSYGRFFHRMFLAPFQAPAYEIATEDVIVQGLRLKLDALSAALENRTEPDPNDNQFNAKVCYLLGSLVEGLSVLEAPGNHVALKEVSTFCQNKSSRKSLDQLRQVVIDTRNSL